MKRKDAFIAKFDAEVGLIAEESIEDQMRRLLDEGFFRGRKCAVVGVSDDENVDFRRAGPRYEALAIAQYMISSIGYAYMKGE